MRHILFPINAEKLPCRELKPNVFSRNGRSLVGIALGSGKSEEISSLVKASVDLIGGIEKLEVKGREVLVKPNVNSDDPYPYTTNPLVVKSVVELLYGAGAKRVIAGDMSGIPWLPTKNCMAKTGIEKAAREAGAEVVYFDDMEWVTVEPERAIYAKSFQVPRVVYEAEKIVSIPVIKTHSIATYSMSLKNSVGITHPRNRRELHASEKMEEMIAEYSLAIHPDLIIIDGTKSLVSGGPTSGTVGDTNLILASGDRIAIDLAGLSIVKSYKAWERVTGRDISDQRQIKRALELKLGKGKGEIEVLGTSLAGEEKLDSLLNAIRREIA